MEPKASNFYLKTPILPLLSQQNLDFTKVDTLMMLQGRFYELSEEQ